MKKLKIKLINELEVDLYHMCKNMYKDGVDVNNLFAVNDWVDEYLELDRFDYTDIKINYKDEEIQKFAIECFKEFEKEENK